MCFSDGTISVDACEVSCKRGFSHVVFKCEAGQTYDCEKACRARNCADRCPLYKKTQGVCASNGRVYTDQCRAQCDDPRLQVWFDCDCPLDRNKCRTRCSHMFYEKNGMKHDHIVKEKEFVYFHTPNVHIYDAVHKNSHRLDALQEKVNQNSQANQEQTHLIEDNTKLIQTGLELQTQAAQTDQIHTQMLSSNAQQIGNLVAGQNQASSERNYIANQIDTTIANQHALSDSHLRTQSLIKQAQDQILSNNAALVQVQKNQASQAAELGTHKRDFAQYRDDFAHHNALLGQVKDELEHHDAALNGLIDAQKAHDGRQSQLIADHSNTQQMIQEHDQNLANFESKNQAEWDNQRAANAENADHNMDHDKFMAEQRNQNNSENNHMGNQKESMHLEKVHLVAEKGGHNIPHNHHGHAYHNVDLAKKTVEIKKPSQVVSVVLPKGSVVNHQLLNKSQYMYKGHVNKYHDDHHDDDHHDDHHKQNAHAHHSHDKKYNECHQDGHQGPCQKH